ncbi:MAG: cell division topological specificity factor MinE [Candidatus Choladocola sp.]|nr:cell division topological specificity factor MinE [Candidatus Choladocola sp.]
MNIYRNHVLRTSGQIAKSRAELAVASDRLDCNQDEMQQMQKDIVNILTRYMNLDKSVFEIRMDIVYEIKRGIRDVKTIQIK